MKSQTLREHVALRRALALKKIPQFEKYPNLPQQHRENILRVLASAILFLNHRKCQFPLFRNNRVHEVENVVVRFFVEEELDVCSPYCHSDRARRASGGI